MTGDGDVELDKLIAKYTDEVAARTHALVAALRARLHGATLLVYDNYNALAIGFASSDKLSSTILSVTAYPRWVSLFFMQGAALDDSHKLLTGSGNQVRSIPRIEMEMLHDPRVAELIAQAVENAVPPLDTKVLGGIIIKSISAKQRPRRPTATN